MANTPRIPLSPYKVRTSMLARIMAAALGVIVLAGPVLARDAIGADAHAWVGRVVERVVERVEAAVERVAAPEGGRNTRTIEVHIRVATDGTVQEVAFGNPPLPQGAEERLRAAIIGAMPFGPPPNILLAPDGTTDLDFPLRISSRRR